ncbi:hypothetical protein Tco_0746395 [Tanacetum coccineum]
MWHHSGGDTWPANDGWQVVQVGGIEQYEDVDRASGRLRRELEAAFEHSGGLRVSIFGLLSGRSVTYKYLRSELVGNWNWIDPRAIEFVFLVFD